MRSEESGLKKTNRREYNLQKYHRVFSTLKEWDRITELTYMNEIIPFLIISLI